MSCSDMFRAQAFVLQNACDEPDVALVMRIVTKHREELTIRAFRKVRKPLSQHVAIRVVIEFRFEDLLYTILDRKLAPNHRRQKSPGPAGIATRSCRERLENRLRPDGQMAQAYADCCEDCVADRRRNNGRRWLAQPHRYLRTLHEFDVHLRNVGHA